ncbi:MAG: hypothetical protein ABW321_19755, partial [Polyangiales bacterium]
MTGASGLLDAAPAQASCAGPPITLLWSYPEDGATNVPTNAVLLGVVQGWASMPGATLNGTKIEVQGSLGFGGFQLEPGALTPDTDYELVLDFSMYAQPGQTRPRVELKFRTGTGPAMKPAAAPRIVAHETSREPWRDHPCADIIQAQDCFDTGQSVLVSVEPAPETDAQAWVLSGDSTALWPARCGDPALYVHDSREPICVTLQRVGIGGLLSEPTEYCVPAAPADGGGAGQGGNAAGGAGGDEADGGVPEAGASGAG